VGVVGVVVWWGGGAGGRGGGGGGVCSTNLPFQSRDF